MQRRAFIGSLMSAIGSGMVAAPRAFGDEERGTPRGHLRVRGVLPLFRSQHKYASRTGWPSFTQPIATHIETRVDRRGREPIVEYHCARCGGHQGHVFDDGPPPRGERWCNNGVALIFVPAADPLPKLRE